MHSNSEVHDFRSGVSALGYGPETFKVEFEDHTSAGVGIFALSWKYTVSRQGFTQTYDGGHGKEWISGALADVSNGKFGTK